MVKVSGSGAEGPVSESLPGHGVMLLGKTFTTDFLLVGFVYVTMTRYGLPLSTSYLKKMYNSHFTFPAIGAALRHVVLGVKHRPLCQLLE